MRVGRVAAVRGPTGIEFGIYLHNFLFAEVAVGHTRTTRQGTCVGAAVWRDRAMCGGRVEGILCSDGDVGGGGLLVRVGVFEDS